METILVGAVVALITGAAVWSMIRDKKSGKHTCGGDCSKCRGCH